jgi:tetratricopeptide (TPR) repeat protein
MLHGRGELSAEGAPTALESSITDAQHIGQVPQALSLAQLIPKRARLRAQPAQGFVQLEIRLFVRNGKGRRFFQVRVSPLPPLDCLHLFLMNAGGMLSMSLVGSLLGFGLRQVIDDSVADGVVKFVAGHFTDHSQALPRALETAHDRSWKALGVALGGDGFLDGLKGIFASGDDKGVREEVARFINSGALPLEGTPRQFRADCLAELKRLRKSGRLSLRGLKAPEIARQAAGFTRYLDGPGLIEGATQAVGQIALALRTDYPRLAKLLGTPTPGRPPLLAAAFAYFFRREVATDEELARGLFFDSLNRLVGGQAKGFADLGKALNELGGRFEEVFDVLGGIAAGVEATRDEVAQLRKATEELLARVGMRAGEVRPEHSFSVRSDGERRAIKVLLERFRQLPNEQQAQVPDLLNGLGKLQVGAGDFAGAQNSFSRVAEMAPDELVRAEGHFNAYRVALEQKKSDEALMHLRQAVALDRGRFAPFPLERYEPVRILGAGGFGTVFHCRDRYMLNRDVAIKALHAAGLERGVEEVFGEAHALTGLNHPAIIGVIDCTYADVAQQARPYIVMSYFAGGSLADFVNQRGTLAVEQLLPIARAIVSGMQAAHARNILHRDLKPDNVLVRKEGESWLVKIIDFGLALRRQVVQTSLEVASAGTQTVLGSSVAGTMRYAPPEQKGELVGAKVGPYSDVYAFGKLCCYALFKTTEPKSRHWASVPGKLAQVLEACTEEAVDERPPSFVSVLEVLEALPLEGQAERELQEKERQHREAVGRREREQAEADERRKREEHERQEKERQQRKDDERRQREERERQQREADQRRQREEHARQKNEAR